MKHIPTRHLSVRVPWHDSGWNGKVCCDPRENGSCMFLPRIQEKKDPDLEEQWAGRWFHELPIEKLPPCVGEKVTFMSPHDTYRRTSHPYAANPNNSAFYGHYQETMLCYPGRSFAVIPYNWMQKDADSGQSKLAEEYKLSYDRRKEPKLNFRNSWVQQIDNQRALLNAFIDPIRPGHSLVFIYAKNIPNTEARGRILIGVGKVTRIGELTEYRYDPALKKEFRSTLWERPVFHSVKEDMQDGFLLPYQELIKQAWTDESIVLANYVAYAPSFAEFSYGSEWVSNDTAIESLLILSERLSKMGAVLPGKDYAPQIAWIDKQLSALWKMRGPFPGLGAVLSGLKIAGGNFLAWELDKLVRDSAEDEVVRDPWVMVDKIIQGDQSFLPVEARVNISDTVKATWLNYSPEEKDFLVLLSRMNVDNDRVNAVINKRETEQVAYLTNPYLLYEESRLKKINFPVALIDKALFTDKMILEKFPLSALTTINDKLDQRRIRAFCVEVLEAAAEAGDTLLTANQLVTRLDEQPVQPLCDPSVRNLEAIEPFLEHEVVRFVLDTEEDLFYFKLTRYEAIKDKIKKFVQKRSQRLIPISMTETWLALINRKFGEIEAGRPEWHRLRDEEARAEKALALEVMAVNRISVLVGPAGTGKTTLIETFCSQSFIQNGTILKLAPTGKARVKLGKDAQTLAQFLIRAKRYNPETGRYSINPGAEAFKYDTVIVDEASMLTEDQLAALIDSLTGVERFILLGDYRQLPPIGAGRPFADIISYLRQQGRGLAELKVLFRHLSGKVIPAEEPDRLDVRLGKWFSDDLIKKEDDNIFKEIAGRPGHEFGNVSFIEWYNVKQLETLLSEVANKEIELLLREQDIPLRNERANFDASLGAIYHEEYKWSNFDIGSATALETWQILTPGRTSGYGTKVLNQEIQKRYRGDTLTKSIKPPKFKKRKMPRPIGDDRLVFGDKLINVHNTKWNNRWNQMHNPANLSEDQLLRYMANGEIGLHIGPYRNWDFEGPRPIYVTFSSQPDYAYQFRESDFQEDGELQMELAYAITVHKSQGSGFKVVLFVLPNPCPILSRELFYTALTRQEDRVVILHQGAFSDYEKYTKGEYSETARRLTDIFAEPQLKLVKKKYYDGQYVQVSAKGEFMISKSEVIIADLLSQYRVQYVYEAAVTDGKGTTIHPDFTFEDSDSGIVYYWEHLGLLTKDDYRSKWIRKLEWYARNHIIDRELDRDAPKQLIITRDKPDGGIDASQIRQLIEELIG